MRMEETEARRGVAVAGVLLCVAVGCRALHSVAVCCSVLQSIAMCMTACNMLQHTDCNKLQHTATYRLLRISSSIRARHAGKQKKSKVNHVAVL